MNCSNSNMKASMITIVIYLYDYINILHSDACLINEGNTFLLTGGLRYPTAVSTVSRYDINGWVEDLNNLNTARGLHGCTRYINKQGLQVMIKKY